MKKIAAAMLCLLAALAGAAATAAPSGRPPMNAAQRVEPRIYDVTLQVLMTTELSTDAFRGKTRREVLNPDTFDLQSARILMPIIRQSTYSAVDADRMSAKLWLDEREVKDIGPTIDVTEDQAHGMAVASLPVGEFTGRRIRFEWSFRVKTWECRLDEQAAQRIPWPRDWPEDTLESLEPQPYIQSDNPVFKQTVDRITEGRLRLVTPYIAAKEIVRYCVNELQISGDGEMRGLSETLHGLELDGAVETARTGRGSPIDLVCVSVAMLRAAGIPARPVIGMTEDDVDGSNELAVWAEMYLPRSGWIPIDPQEMRSHGMRNRDVDRAWPGFGTMKNMNRRVPLSFAFHPPGTTDPPRAPAAWGWAPSARRLPAWEPRLSLEFVSRGPAPPEGR